jgi:putative ABC transport system permease protein
MTFDAAGITAYVAGVVRSDDPQDHNVAYTALEFVQLAGRDQLGIVTQFNVKVRDASMLDRVADDIDALFANAQEPTATFSEKAFIGRVADDIIELVGFARWLGLGCLAAVLALVANAIVLSVQSRISEHAVLQTLGFSGGSLRARSSSRACCCRWRAAGSVRPRRSRSPATASFALSVEGISIPIVGERGLLLSGLLVCGAIGVLAGLVPAWQASRREIAACFRAA